MATDLTRRSWEVGIEDRKVALCFVPAHNAQDEGPDLHSPRRRQRVNIPRARPQSVQDGAGQAADQEFRKLAGVYNHLTGMALQGADIASITAILAERVGNTVVVVDEGLTPLAVASPLPKVAPNPRVWAANRRLQHALRSVAEKRRAP